MYASHGYFSVVLATDRTIYTKPLLLRGYRYRTKRGDWGIIGPFSPFREHENGINCFTTSQVDAVVTGQAFAKQQFFIDLCHILWGGRRVCFSETESKKGLNERKCWICYQSMQSKCSSASQLASPLAMECGKSRQMKCNRHHLSPPEQPSLTADHH